MSFNPRPAAIRPLLAMGLALVIALYLMSFFLPAEPKPAQPPDLAWAPGYWEVSPLLGIVRVVPLAKFKLVNPAAQAAPTDNDAILYSR